MGEQFQSLSLFLLLLLTFQEMMLSEAALCKAPSKTFHGLCFSSKNCLAICEKEGFLSGECKRLKCVCAKDCKSGESPGDSPPDDGEEPGAPGQGGDDDGEKPVPPGQGGDDDGEEPGPPGQGGDDDGEEPVAHPPKKAGGRGKPPGPPGPEQGGDDDGEEPVVHPPKNAGGGRAKPPVHSRRYLLNN